MVNIILDNLMKYKGLKVFFSKYDLKSIQYQFILSSFILYVITRSQVVKQSPDIIRHRDREKERGRERDRDRERERERKEERKLRHLSVSNCKV